MLPIAVALLVGVGVGVAIGVGWWTRRNPSSTVVVERPVDRDDIAGRLSEAVDHLEIGVVISSPSGAVLYRNAAARSTRGTHVGLVLDDQLSSIIAETGAGERVASSGRAPRSAAFVVRGHRRSDARRWGGGDDPGRQRANADRRDAHRLRHQHLPRAQDAGGRDRGSGRGADGRGGSRRGAPTCGPPGRPKPTARSGRSTTC